MIEFPKYNVSFRFVRLLTAFEHGLGRTLASYLTHANRTERLPRICGEYWAMGETYFSSNDDWKNYL